MAGYLPTINCFSLATSRYLSYIAIRAVLIEQLFPKIFSLFFQEKQEKREKQETFPKFGNLTEGKIFGRLRIPMFGRKKWKVLEIQKIAQ